MKSLSIIFTISLILVSCKKQNTVAYQPASKVEQLKPIPHKGKKLMEQKCYVCHSPNASMTERLAPPMIAVKKHYISDEMPKKKFAAAIWNWIENPSEENSKMRGAVRRFGVMPYLEFNKEEIESIANYVFDNEIEQPEWFEKHYSEMRGKKNKN